MLDPMINRWLKKPVTKIAKALSKTGITANQLTITGFLVGLSAIPTLATGHNLIALILILLNRLIDGLDGALARETTITDAGGFLDITLDFIFYSGVVFGFALYNPEKNALFAALLIFSFMGTASSFLAFAALAEKRKISAIVYPHKSIYYLGGITEGFETILLFVVICVFPRYFVPAAGLFAGLCWITTIFRIIFGYLNLRTEKRETR